MFLDNLADRAVTVDLGPSNGVVGRPYEVLGDVVYAPPTRTLTGLALNGWGYRWIRLRRGHPH